MINQYTVIGQPIKHSLSPGIHHLFGELTQRRINYTRSEATPDTFARTVIDWQQAGGMGCNITLPFKQLALEVCDRLSISAQRAQAVNTIHMHRDGSRVGHNTDGSGLLQDISVNQGYSLSGKRIILIGAGGAARGVLGPLLKASPATVHVANRTQSRAEELATTFGHLGTTSASDLQSLNDYEPFDVVINATSLSLQGQVPAIPSALLAPAALSYDMMYAAEDTPFMSWSRKHGASTVCNGFGMLIEQAADAFFIWEGVRPKTRLALPRLRKLLADHVGH